MPFPMSDILTTIRDLAAMELEDIGNDEAAQNTAIFRLVTVVLRKRARQAYLVETSDALNITTDDYHAFLKNSAVISDMYEPLSIYNASGTPVSKRTSWDAPIGWFRESENNPVHTKGMNGSYSIKYLRYPKAITAQGDVVEFPLAAQMDIIMDTVSLIKLPKNYYDESNAIKARATGTAIEKATVSARGSTTWKPPSEKDKEE